MAERSDVVIGLALGDEGKGTTVDYLASQQKTNAVIRFSGGAQTQHNVITPEGKHHTFAQFGSASFHNIPTILSRYVLVNPLGMAEEANKLGELLGFDPFLMAAISENALLNTPLHGAVNKLREIARGANRHGSCGWGVGETQYYENISSAAPRVKDLRNLDGLRQKLEVYRLFAETEVGDISQYAPNVDDLIASYKLLLEDRPFNIVSDDFISEQIATGYNIFEGSQGVLLDEELGFHPHTTWSTTTAERAKILAAEAGIEVPQIVGVTRSYTTRHGHGPFPSEFATEDEWVNSFPERHNERGEFQGGWRAGLLDLVLLNYGVRANQGIDVLSLTHLDYPYKAAVTAYSELHATIPDDLYKGDRTRQEALTALMMTPAFKESAQVTEIRDEAHLIELMFQNVGGVKPLIKSYGPTWMDKRKG